MNNVTNAKSLLAITFGQGFIPPNIPIATFKQGDKELNFILDTGSDNNVVDKECLESIEHTIDDSQKFNLAGVGTDKNIVQVCNIPFQYGEDSFTEQFLISDLKGPFTLIRKCHAIPLHGMLGSNFLKKQGLILDFKNFTAYSKK